MTGNKTKKAKRGKIIKNVIKVPKAKAAPKKAQPAAEQAKAPEPKKEEAKAVEEEKKEEEPT